MNVVVGENDSGKSALVDAIRLTLGTRSDDYRVSVDDFHVPTGGLPRATSFEVRCSFNALSEDEQISFLEWTSISAAGAVTLDVVLKASLADTKGGGKRVYTELRSGALGDGPAVQGALREYVRVTYLRPLRDAENELGAGRRSRLSAILGALPDMHAERTNDFIVGGLAEPVTLAGIAAKADHHIRENPTVGSVEGRINDDYLTDLSVGSEKLRVSLALGTATSFTQVLERLELALRPPSTYTEPLRRGLGLNNVLFMAAELLVLQSQPEQVSLLLIEEPEAHLHPQLQARFMQIMSERVASNHPLQVILTTHSPQLAAQAKLEDVCMMVGGRAFPLSPNDTKLEPGDYEFLRRFLDATKANLLFARGVLIVEGDAENLLLPAIAEKLGRSFSANGVSVVNVGHVGLFRYSRILRRNNAPPLPVPVACVADRDIPPDAAKKSLSEKRKTAKDIGPAELAQLLAKRCSHDGENVRTFVSEQWTLEYDLALAGLAGEIWAAIGAAEGGPLDVDAARAEVTGWGGSPEDVAVKVYCHMLDKRISKPVVAQVLAAIIRALPDSRAAFASRIPTYLHEAIAHVAPTVSPEPDPAAAA
jgi:putative ATP-dependent endonuclease of OLD family